MLEQGRRGGTEAVAAIVAFGAAASAFATRYGSNDIAGLAGDPRRRRAMGNAARWRVKRHFSMRRMIEEYASAYFGRHIAIAAAPANAPTPADAISVNDATRSLV